MDLVSRIESQFEESMHALRSAHEVLTGPLNDAVQLLVECLLGNGKILACGEGPSAADAQRFVTSLMSRFERERPQLAALSLLADSQVLGALTQTYAWRQVFARQIDVLGHPGDVLLAIDSAGNPASLLDAISAAHDRDMRVVAMTGQDASQIEELLGEHDVHICVPHTRPARIQEIHILAIHSLCDGIDCLLMGDDQ